MLPACLHDVCGSLRAAPRVGYSGAAPARVLGGGFPGFGFAEVVLDQLLGEWDVDLRARVAGGSGRVAAPPPHSQLGIGRTPAVSQAMERHRVQGLVRTSTMSYCDAVTGDVGVRR